MDYNELGLDSNLNKEDTFQLYNVINADTQIEDESIMGTKLVEKSVALDRLYGTDLQVGGSSNISGRIQVLNSANSPIITLDATGGLNVVDGNGNTVFHAVVTGGNVGDITLGNYGASNGLFFDPIAGLSVKGAINLGTGSTLSADFITTGTLNASLVNVININASNIKTGDLTVGGAGHPAFIQLLQGGTGGGGDAFLLWDGGNQIWSDPSNFMGFLAFGEKFYFYGGANHLAALIQRSDPSGNFYAGLAVVGGDFQFDGVSHFIRGQGENVLRFRGGLNSGQDTIEFWNPAGNTKVMSIHTGDGGKIYTDKEEISLDTRVFKMNNGNFTVNGNGHTLTLNADVTLP